MTDEFDPSYKWLGIPPNEQPAHHYRLLGIPLFASDPDVIENAAEQRIRFLRTVQTGPRGACAHRLLSDIAHARTILLNAERKAAYDLQLSHEFCPPSPAAIAPRDVGLPFSADQAGPNRPPLSAPGSPPLSPSPRDILAAPVSIKEPSRARVPKKFTKQSRGLNEFLKIIIGGFCGIGCGYTPLGLE